jgi:hypothetical protein
MHVEQLKTTSKFNSEWFNAVVMRRHAAIVHAAARGRQCSSRFHLLAHLGWDARYLNGMKLI